jgi:hypothetical protein
MTLTTTDIQYTQYADFNPRAYLAEYHAEVIQDEQLCLEFLIDSLRKIPAVSVALDFGCGPVVSHLVPLAAKAQEVHAAEYLAVNRAEVEKWLTQQPDAYDWRQFTLEILRLEGNTQPTIAEAEKREQQTRDRTTQVLACDLNKFDPLGGEKREFYPLVTSHYCAEGISPNVDSWRTYMRHLMSLVKPGGALILTSCGSTTARNLGDFYRVGDTYYPLTTVSPQDVLNCFAENGFVDLDLRVRKLSNPGEQGYDCLIFACGFKENL